MRRLLLMTMLQAATTMTVVRADAVTSVDGATAAVNRSMNGLNSGSSGGALRVPGSTMSILEKVDAGIIDSEDEDDLVAIAQSFAAFFVLAVVQSPDDPRVPADSPRLVKSANNADVIVAAVGKADPMLASTIRITNPFNEDAVFRIESAIDLDLVDGATAVAEGFFSAQVFDTGGEVGAELEFSMGHTVRVPDFGNAQLDVPALFHEDIISVGELSTLDVSETPFISLGSDFDQVLSSTFVTISAGDTAELTSVANLGDATMPLLPLPAVTEILSRVDRFAQSVPEPSAGFLIWIGVAGVWRRGCRSSHGAATCGGR